MTRRRVRYAAGVVIITTAQAAVIAQAPDDAEQYRRKRTADWCDNCEAASEGACEDHLDDLDQADAYRDLSAALDYQRGAVMTGERCAWPGCGVTAKRGRLMCYRHWVNLPRSLRAPIWEHYRPGQTALTASPEYLDALRAVLSYAQRVNAKAERQAGRRQQAEHDQEAVW